MRYNVQHLLIIILLCVFNMLHGQKTALLIIDVQDFYFPGGRLQLEKPEEAGMNAGLLLDHFRKIALPVYHVRHNFEPGGNIHHYVKPINGESVISKDEVNVFLNTELLDILQGDSVGQLVICGMQTHMCVEAAVRAAHDFGFSCLLVSDACATRALQYEEHIIPAKNVHFSTIQTLKDTYAKVITTEELLREFNQFIR
ncbi:MAG: isochorismatase family protein [Bacteroidales bacterium]|nr:isochorismatase family protein [Bacteroidales bacterium]